MTETQQSKRSPRGGMGLGLKSGILAASFGTVLLGWSLLARAETAVSHPSSRSTATSRCCSSPGADRPTARGALS